MVSPDGPIATGEHIISHTASSIKRTHMELGGKAPVIVFDDADIEAVVEGVRTFGYYNAGQDCTAACRIYAQKGIYDTLVEKLGAAVATLKSGALTTSSRSLDLAAGASRTRQQGSRRGESDSTLKHHWR